MEEFEPDDLVSSNFDVKCEMHKQMIREWTPEAVDAYCLKHGFTVTDDPQ